jgi:hypothetical protein
MVGISVLKTNNRQKCIPTDFSGQDDWNFSFEKKKKAIEVASTVIYCFKKIFVLQ